MGAREPYDSEWRVRTQEAGQLLAEVAQLLAATLDFDERLEGVAKIAVRLLADLCVIDLVEDGEVRRLQAVHSDPACAGLTRELLGFPLDWRRPHLSLEALGARRPVLIPRVSDLDLEVMTQGPEHRRLVEALRPRSVMAVPLLARDRLLGVILFVSSSRTYDGADLMLAERLAQLAALELDNARLYGEAQRTLQERDQMLGIVAHDLRYPLNTIIMGTQLLLDDSFPEPRRRSQSEMILRSGLHMNRLIQDLLDVARIGAAQLVLHREIQKPEQLAREAVEANVAMAAAKSISLLLRPCRNLPSITADRDRLLQVLSNLIGNAVKFTPNGGSISVYVQPAEGGVRFSVSDTGRGVPPEDLPRLFQPYWQAQRGSLDGAGLGLMIAHRIVEAHGGKIWAESTPGRGSTFHFSLPAVSAPQQPESAEYLRMARPRPGESDFG